MLYVSCMRSFDPLLYMSDARRTLYYQLKFFVIERLSMEQL